jgi:hypothetical protein
MCYEFQAGLNSSCISYCGSFTLLDSLQWNFAVESIELVCVYFGGSGKGFHEKRFELLPSAPPDTPRNHGCSFLNH